MPAPSNGTPVTPPPAGASRPVPLTVTVVVVILVVLFLFTGVIFLQHPREGHSSLEFAGLKLNTSDASFGCCVLAVVVVVIWARLLQAHITPGSVPEVAGPRPAEGDAVEVRGQPSGGMVNHSVPTPSMADTTPDLPYPHAFHEAERHGQATAIVAVVVNILDDMIMNLRTLADEFDQEIHPETYLAKYLDKIRIEQKWLRRVQGMGWLREADDWLHIHYRDLDGLHASICDAAAMVMSANTKLHRIAARTNVSKAQHVEAFGAVVEMLEESIKKTTALRNRAKSRLRADVDGTGVGEPRHRPAKSSPSVGSGGITREGSP